MRETIVTCDSCRRKIHDYSSVQVIYYKNREPEFNFCDRKCLIDYAEKNPEFKRENII